MKTKSAYKKEYLRFRDNSYSTWFWLLALGCLLISPIFAFLHLYHPTHISLGLFFILPGIQQIKENYLSYQANFHQPYGDLGKVKISTGKRSRIFSLVSLIGMIIWNTIGLLILFDTQIWRDFIIKYAPIK